MILSRLLIYWCKRPIFTKIYIIQSRLLYSNILPMDKNLQITDRYLQPHWKICWYNLLQQRIPLEKFYPRPQQQVLSSIHSTLATLCPPVIKCIQKIRLVNRTNQKKKLHRIILPEKYCENVSWWQPSTSTGANI